MADSTTLEDQFRDNIRDMLAVLECFAPICKTPDDLVGMLKLALVNDGQLQLLLNKLTPLHKRIVA